MKELKKLIISDEDENENDTMNMMIKEI